MQLARQDIQIIEKVVSTENGLFLARFAVANVGGTFKAKLIEMVPMPSEDAAALSTQTLLIESPRVDYVADFIEPVAKAIVSPFTELFFFVSQPTRAPSLA